MSKGYQYWIRKLHRWVALLVAIQMIAWISGGLYFSLFPIQDIRGEHLLHPTEPLTAQALEGALSPDQLRNILSDKPIAQLSLVNHLGKAHYRVIQEGEILLFDASSGEKTKPIDADQASAIAKAALIPEANVTTVKLLTQVPRGDEYREQPLPAYQVEFDHDSGVRIYVAQQTGEITTRRTDRWRIFDFLWMLHVMDYQDRDNFNHWLLTLVASIALFVSLSGVLLWWNSTPWRRRRRTMAR